jgi:hypothetical protein
MGGLYAVITTPILAATDINPRQKILLALISYSSTNKGYSFRTNSYFAEILRCNKTTISLDIKALEEAGYLGSAIFLKPSGEVDYRALTLTEKCLVGDHLTDWSDAPPLPNTSTPFVKYKDPFVNHKGIIGERKDKEEEPPISPTGGDLKMEGFDEFWKLYPRHTSRKVAELKWKGLSPTQKDAAIKALPKHIQGWAGKEMQFIPHPATWLNQRRWEDEVVSDSTKVSTQPATQPQKAYTMYKVRNAPGTTTYPGKLTYFATWEGGNKWCHFGNMSPVPFTHSGNPDRPYINHPITEEVDKAIRAAFSVAGYIDNFDIITFDQINQITKW